MKCVLSICADTASLDKAANTVSLFSLIDGVSTHNFPTTLPHLAMLFILKRETGDKKSAGHATLTFEPIKGEVQEKGKAVVRFDFEGKPNLRVLIRADGISIESPGTLYSRLFQKDKCIGEWAIEIRLKKEAPLKTAGAEVD